MNMYTFMDIYSYLYVYLHMSSSQLLQKRCFDDGRLLEKLQIAVPMLHAKPWILVKWYCPAAGRYKLNADGCCKGNPGKGGGGSILRNSAGEVLFAQAVYYGETTNSVVENKALLQGLELCKTRGIDGVDIEVDPMMLVQIMHKKISVPWAIVYEVRLIEDILQKMVHSLKHIFRESNKAADFLANVGFKEKKKVVFCTVSMPKKLTGIIASFWLI